MAAVAGWSIALTPVVMSLLGAGVWSLGLFVFIAFATPSAFLVWLSFYYLTHRLFPICPVWARASLSMVIYWLVGTTLISAIFVIRLGTASPDVFLSNPVDITLSLGLWPSTAVKLAIFPR